MDAANVDLKAFTDDFYFKLCGSNLQPVLDTLVYEPRDRLLARDHHPADPRQERRRRRLKAR
jgi:pyruvate-formate lyase-activating enzyme